LEAHLLYERISLYMSAWIDLHHSLPQNPMLPHQHSENPQEFRVSWLYK